MMNKKLHTPYGVRDYLPKACKEKNEIERRIEAVFSRYGYLSVKSPMFEYSEVFEGTGSIREKQMYKFIDRDGRILVLRPDITPPIARMAATNFTAEDIPLRFCYMGNVFRYNESYQGKFREFTQAGIELIGTGPEASGVSEADSEAVAVAVNSLLSTGLRDFHIDIGQVRFLKTILEDTGFDPEQQAELQDFIIERNFVAVRNMAERGNLTEGVKALLMDLPMFIGSAEVLERARALTENPKAHEALESLEVIRRILASYGLSQYVRFDLSAIGHLDYYTGIIFNGYAFGTGFSILNGGRYDRLAGKFGADFPSVGFSIKINELMFALENQRVEIPASRAETLLAYTKEGRAKALSTGEALRRQGLSVENSLFGADMEKNLAYAKKKGVGGILFFVDDENITVYDVKKNTRTTVTEAELLKGAAD